MQTKRFSDILIVTVIISILLLVTATAGCISDPGEAKIVDVKKGSPADRNGLKKGMIIKFINYGEGVNFTKVRVERYDRVGEIISSVPPGEQITVGVQYNDGEMVFDHIELAENPDHTRYLGIECGPGSGLVLNINYVIVYFFVIVTISILIFIASALEKWMDRRKNGPDL